MLVHMMTIVEGLQVLLYLNEYEIFVERHDITNLMMLKLLGLITSVMMERLQRDIFIMGEL